MLSESTAEINYSTDALPDAPTDAPDEPMTPLPLSAKHLAELRGSGLDDATIRASGICSTTDNDRIGMVLRWTQPYHGQHGGALEIPFFDLHGKKVTGYRRLKFDRPRKKNDKALKYESPVGVSNRAFLSPFGTGDAATDTTIEVIFTEGEKKALALIQTIRRNNWKAIAIGLVGVYGFAKKRKKDSAGKPIGDRELLPDLDAFTWQGRKVYIVYDSDAATNPNVQYAEYELAHALTARGASVVVVRLPSGDDGSKIGIDDYLLTHSADDLRGLMDSAQPATQPEQKTVVNEAVDDPDKLGRGFLKAHYTKADTYTLRVYLGSYWRHVGTHYVQVADDEIEAEYRHYINGIFDSANEEALAKWLANGAEGNPPTKHKIHRGLIANVGDAVRSHVIVPADKEMPCWLDKKGEEK